MVSDVKGMGEVLNEFFGTVFTREELDSVPHLYEGGRGEMSSSEFGLSEIDITKEKITREIMEMKENKAAGDDGLQSTFIKELVGVVAAPLAVLF